MENNRLLYKLFKEGEIKGINKAPIFKKNYGNLNISYLANFIFLLNSLLFIPIHFRIISKNNLYSNSFTNFLLYDIHCIVFSLIYSCISKHTLDKNSKLKNQLSIIKLFLTCLIIKLTYDSLLILNSFRLFIDFIKHFLLFNKNNLVFNINSSYGLIGSYYLVLCILFLLFCNNYTELSNKNIVILGFLIISQIIDNQNYLDIVKIILMYINFIFYIPELFKYFNNISKVYSYVQISFGIFLHCHSIYNSNIKTKIIIEYEYKTCGIIFCINFILIFVYTSIYNFFYKLKKDKIKGKWDLPLVTNYY